MEFFDPEGRFILQWNKTFLLFSVVALSLDPLFFYIPVVDGTQKCLDVDRKLEVVLCVLRSFADMLYVFHIIIQFRTAYVPRYNHILGKRLFIDEPHYVARRYLKSYFVIDVLASFPLPQVVGALWYLFAIESELRCWNIACQRHNYDSKYLYCGEGRVGDFGFLKSSCPLLERNEIKDSANFDFGLFLDALQTRVLETSDFRQKFLYCSWWGLQSLSSLGQGLKASTYYGEILFADFIAVIGLVLFALLIGNIQKYLQSFSNLTLRVEEMKEKRREAEELMSHVSLPEQLRERVRRHKQYKWKITRGVELNSFVRDLPRDLRRDIKRHLCLFSLRRVPLFEQMDEHLLDAMCDGLKPVLYTETSRIIVEGDPVPEMLFITRGEVLSVTTDGGRTGFFNSITLRAGDFCGEELLTWALDPTTPILPFSTRTVQAVTDVQAFALEADKLMSVASQFRRLHSRSLQHTFRFYSQQWRTWAACYIQSVWRRHRRRKQLKTLKEQDRRLQDALATSRETSTLSIGASINVLRFSSNALRFLRRKHIYNGEISTTKFQLLLPLKPVQPDFDNDTTTFTSRSDTGPDGTGPEQNRPVNSFGHL
ncbi:cyclic nucleotide-gated ion channel 1-like isoform X2 [Cynara cardunculus var. scolymus]|uniref:cyclic nucleotide-gated ion channel 1-like isoform X2 n=1 Tax=Cynara cardunculus var. scolymus TaxID=59895 RepID=UPI000D626FAA|nr:cyclic nucleotide-gated ion channel 1-like isoform X2 [Cynara cardunculus var. scolymus]